MSSDTVQNIERSIFKTWEMSMSNEELIDCEFRETSVSHDIVETVND
jgi:hypothetical protein